MSKGKLLLADDSVTIQKVVNLTFADEGIEVFTAGDGDSAMEKFVADKPDLVLADVNMPGLNGYEICERIKQNEATRNVPVILLVGSFEPFDEEKARSVGADDFLTKPFQSIRQLVKKVSDLLESETKEALKVELAREEFAAPETANSGAGENFFAQNAESEPDEETVNTNQIGSLPVDDVHRFGGKLVSEFSEEDFDNNQTPEESEESQSSETGLENIEAQESGDAPQSLTETAPENIVQGQFETGETRANEYNYSEEASAAAADDNTDEFAAPKEEPQTGAKIFDDEINLLEIPQASPAAFANFSPEFIEAVANRVVEKLSDRVVREIAGEVVPQTADSIIRKMAEERFSKE